MLTYIIHKPRWHVTLAVRGTKKYFSPLGNTIYRLLIRWKHSDNNVTANYHPCGSWQYGGTIGARMNHVTAPCVHLGQVKQFGIKNKHMLKADLHVEIFNWYRKVSGSIPGWSANFFSVTCHFMVCCRSLFFFKHIFLYQFARFTKYAPPCGCACQLHRRRQNH